MQISSVTNLLVLRKRSLTLSRGEVQIEMSMANEKPRSVMEQGWEVPAFQQETAEEGNGNSCCFSAFVPPPALSQALSSRPAQPCESARYKSSSAESKPRWLPLRLSAAAVSPGMPRESLRLSDVAFWGNGRLATGRETAEVRQLHQTARARHKTGQKREKDGRRIDNWIASR